MHFYATGAFGMAWKYDPNRPGVRTGRQPVRTVMTGVVFQARRAHPPRPAAPAAATIPAVPPPPAGQPR